jgi:NDP-sugar pyrophosphorylase family protein
MGLVANNEVKKEVSKWKQYFNLIHKGAEVYSGAYIEPGAVVMEGASVFEDAIIERNAVVKSGVICNARIMEDVVVDAGNACVRGVISQNIETC